ncbi:class F sortase [Geodermatophilus sp. YIM 151500]|uniref:class F sortase n=1 Tax=Geodermatophilus sp. YIM 151500 TaxID=2984531 RepID=UPI0021E36BB2|nr:class F sortase [Geodermatophilus sp. YIM 151500]MCV2488784.1 class F sortase [Geodermatophilus sp. YIM 151500]
MLALVALVGTVALAVPDADRAPAATPGSGSTRPVVLAEPLPAPEPATGAEDPAEPAGAVLPVRIRVPAAGVDSGLVPLGVDGAGALEVPQDFGTAGWFTGGAVPGRPGPAVVVGHVDSYEGPAVFHRLPRLGAGDEVVVDLDDGASARFTVTRVTRVGKDAFPTDEVYGPTAGAELRLITCGGAFDDDRRRYEDNVIVFARLT